MRLGIHLLRKPVRFGVWNIRTSTLSAPNSAIKGASRAAHDADGVSRVPRSASVRNEIVKLGLFKSAVRIVDIFSD